MPNRIGLFGSTGEDEFHENCGHRRNGMVLEQDGGALPKMLVLFRLFAGGSILSGTRWISWIHRRDHIGLIQRALRASTLSGPLNAVALWPVTMNEFSKTLGKVLHRPSWLPVPAWR